MKFAIESLPELIGADDFKDLCLLLRFHEVGEPVLSGEDFARYVRQRGLDRRLQARGQTESPIPSETERFPSQHRERP